MSTAVEHINGVERDTFDPVALARADAIRKEAEAKAEAEKIRAQAEAEAARIKAEQEAEKIRLSNERERQRQERAHADHEAKIAEANRKKAEADAAAAKARKQAEAEEKAEADLAAERQRAEAYWKWGARGIYAVGLIIAAPIQFLAFWDKERPFLVAAPALLEGLALVLAFGAAWAVAHRRDVAPYRIGIMLGAMLAAGINLWHGLTDPHIGFNAGLIGALASLGGPVVLMAYEHGVAQKADGIPSWREKREAARKKAEAEEKRAKAEAEEKAKRAAAEAAREEREKAAAEEQQRKDNDRKTEHADIWAIADSIRAARGEPVVSDALWQEVWLRETGCKTVGVTPDMEARSRANAARMQAVTGLPVLGALSQVESQKGPRQKKDPEAPDGRASNGGTPPIRKPGDTAPYSTGARRQMAVEQTQEKQP